MAQRIGVISNFASPAAGGVVSGRYYDNAYHATNAGAQAGAVNRADVFPFFVSSPFAVDAIGVVVTAAAAGGLGRCFIYDAGDDGWPDKLLWEADSNLDFGATGHRQHLLPDPFVFDRGRAYWLGLRHSSTAAVRSVVASSCVNLGLAGPTGSTYFTACRRIIPFSDPLPSKWGFSAGELVASAGVPSVRMRAA
ncbi:MAG: hypothetical protein Q4G25_15105 [Paracoccus sp. (in: a-proteobacteria)]|nr:hypothetical protein [Paracoccus sp. (in: a-proteobacteria)]